MICGKPAKRGVKEGPCQLAPGHAGDCTPWEPPTVTYIGNMNDLLAGTGSKDTDDNLDCNGGPVTCIP